jgi:hypothetical protein
VVVPHATRLAEASLRIAVMPFISTRADDLVRELVKARAERRGSAGAEAQSRPIRRAFLAGASAVLEARGPPAQAVDTIWAASRGLFCLPVSAAAAVLAPRPSAGVSDEELRWLRSLATEHTVAQLARDENQTERRCLGACGAYMQAWMFTRRHRRCC